MKHILFSLWVFLLVFNWGQAQSESSTQRVSGQDSADGTAEMAVLLKKLATQGNPVANYHWNTKRAESLLAQAKQASGNTQLRLWYFYCGELLNSGNAEQCIKELEAYLAQLNLPETEALNDKHRPIFELLALAYLRLGENENCQHAHTAESCILPLQGGGIHQLPKGSTRAKALYALLNSRYPDDKYRWLYNLAAMTLDAHEPTEGEPYIPFPNWELEQQNFPRFEEVAMQVGLADDGLLGGTSVEDFNNDGLLDVFVTSHGVADPVKLFLNDEKGGFEEVTEAAGLTGIVGGFNCVHADYDNDGWVDVLVLRGAWLHDAGNHPNSLLKNMGDGTFQDRTRSAGLLSFHPTQTATWADFDRDGWLDLFIGNEGGPDEPHACELFRNKGDGTFEEVAASHGLGGIQEYVKGCAWGDVDQDGWPDLFVSVLGGNNLLFQNVEGQFKEVAKSAGVQAPYYSFPCWFWDVNNDGLLDLFTNGYDLTDLNGLGRDYAAELQGKQTTSEKPRLYLNQGNFTFSDATAAYGLDRTMYAMGANFGDLDNDGFLDCYIGTGAPDFSTVVPNRMFHNLDGKRFEEVTSAGNFGHIQKGHAVAFADLDRDGDQDIYEVMGGAYEGDRFTNILYENPTSGANWIVVELEGTTSNRSCIGCRIQVELKDGQSLYRTVGTGGSFGASSLQQEIGLGQEAVKRITIHWTTGESQTFSKVPVNQKIRIVEGAKKIKIIPYTTIPFRKGGAHEHHHH